MVRRTFLAGAAASMLSFATKGTAHASSDKTAHDFSFTDLDGQLLSLDQFEGQAVLVVNTASRCGFTDQYGPLQALSERYRDQGLVVLAVPSNDFGGQEPLNEQEIRDFTKSAYGVDFPITAKAKVRGNEAHPFYQWAREQVSPLGKPRWNFHKYLIGPNGQMVDWFSSMTAPDSPKLARAIDRVLAN